MADTVSKGRPRDQAIDGSVLDAALAELATKGYAGFSLTSVAEAAGTTRPAVYRRWPDKVALVVDAIASLAQEDPPRPTGRAFEDLVAELQHFRRCITEVSALPVAGIMLGDDVDPAVRRTYVDQVVVPRRTRLRAVLTAAVRAGELSPDADLEIAGSLMTGSWYALAVAGATVPDDWAVRVARLVWTACGGRPDDAR